MKTAIISSKDINKKNCFNLDPRYYIDQQEIESNKKDYKKIKKISVEIDVNFANQKQFCHIVNLLLRQIYKIKVTATNPIMESERNYLDYRIKYERI